MRRLLSLCVCLCLVSCSKDNYGDHPPYPTSGQVLVNGEPAGDALIVFHHLDNWGKRSIVPQAWTDAEGRFVLSTYAMDDGAPAGEYRVVVEWPAYHSGRSIGADKLGGKFSKLEASQLKAHVEKGTNVLPPFDLRATLVKVDNSKLGKRRGKQGGDR
jgi:hypothetical protein